MSQPSLPLGIFISFSGPLNKKLNRFNATNQRHFLMQVSFSMTGEGGGEAERCQVP